jgi:hypothetical protein
MSLNSLKIASDGYLKRTTKAVLVIAVAGYLNFSGTPPIPPSGGGGGGGYATASYRDHEKENRERREREEREETEFVINFLKTATDIINNQ